MALALASGVRRAKHLISSELPLAKVMGGVKMVMEGKTLRVAINPELPAK
jgi:hypothetical protein